MPEKLTLRDDFPPHTEAEWRAAVEAQLKGKPFEKLIRANDAGIEVQPMYFASALDALPAVGAQPGFLPYLRAARAVRDPDVPWAVAQEIPYPDPATFNAAARHDLARGQDTLNIPLDRATRSGLGPAEAPAEDVGAGGLSVASMADLAVALEGVDLARVPVVVHPGPCGLSVTAMLVALHESRGGRARELRGLVATDPVGHLAAAGSLPVSAQRAWLELAQLTAWARDFTPGLATHGLHGDVWREAGANAVQELGWTLAAAVEGIRQLGALGLDVNEVAPRTALLLTVGSDFFLELAKLRAARLVWARMVEAFGGDEDAQRLRLHARTLRWNKTVTDPWVNMLRVTTEAFSAVCGGADALHVAPFDEPAGLPTEFSRRVARNVQLVLREEAHAGATVDPAGGSYYVETLTHEIAARAWAVMQDTEARGGILRALQDGWVQGQIQEVAAARQRRIARRQVVFVGTNQYPNLGEKPVETHPVDWGALRAARAQEARRAQQQAGGPGERQTALVRLAARAEAPDAMNVAILAARAGASLGDLTCALWGDDAAVPQVAPLRPARGGAPFEALRERTSRYAAAHGGRAPAVFLANLGPLAKHKPRTDFARSFFELAGFSVISPDGADSADAAARAAVDSGAEVVCICSSDDLYPEHVPALAAALKAAARPPRVYLAGRPAEHLEAFRAAGVDDFIYLGSDALGQLEALQAELGVQP